MTDVEANNAGNKRKSFSNKQGKKDSPKKFKPENAKTPQKGKTFDKNATPKQQNKPQKALDKNATPKAQKKSPNKQNSTQKPNVKNNQTSNSDSSKKLKPFAGTSEIQSGGGKDKKIKNENKVEGEEKGPKRKRASPFVDLTAKVKAGDKEVIKTLENKIKDIQSRSELTKTAKRKLKLLIKLKNAAEGKTPSAPVQATPNAKSASTKRRDRKKKAVIVAKETSEIKSGGAKTNGKANQKGKPENKQIAKKAKLEQKQEDDSEDEDESDEAEEESGAEEDDESGTEAVEGESSDEVEGESEDEVEGEESDEDEESDEFKDEEDEEESPPQGEESDSSEEADVPKKIKREKAENATKNMKNLDKAVSKNTKTDKTEYDTKNVNLDELKKNNLVGKNQKRFVLFVGNIPYETNKLDLIDHFKKCGEIKHIRIPTEKKTSRPRGFAYVEVGNEETYQKCLSMHHSFLKERRINVLYTQGGKKKGEEKKKEIKAKNFKLHAMRKQGKLAGSKKEVQKRSFRRAKQRAIKSEQEME